MQLFTAFVIPCPRANLSWQKKLFKDFGIGSDKGLLIHIFGEIASAFMNLTC